MRTLVIHPADKSTDFLIPIYSNIYSLPDDNNVTVIRNGVSKRDVKELIRENDRIIMMGHGSPSGLFQVGQFRHTGNPYIIDNTMVDVLSEKTNSLYIWCNADLFVQHHSLKGFYTGMFISEYHEARYCNVDAYKGEVEKSNDLFADIVASNINEDLQTLWKNTKRDYNLYGGVCDYNRSRLYLAD